MSGVRERRPLFEVMNNVTGGNRKIPLKDYADSGLLPVVDQGKNLIGGFTNNREAGFSGKLPCVIFGDHTRIFKYVDFEFALGADGVRVLVSSTEEFLPKFLFYYLKTVKIPDAGYSRHFKFLRHVTVPVYPLDEQRRIIDLLDSAVDITRRSDTVLSKAKTIIPSLFIDTFGDPSSNPKEWPMVTLADIIVKITGGKNLQAGNGSSPYSIIKVSAVTSGIFKPDECKPAPDAYVPSPDHHIREGDFLFSRANTSELVGAVAIARSPPRCSGGDAPFTLLS